MRREVRSHHHAGEPCAETRKECQCEQQTGKSGPEVAESEVERKQAEAAAGSAAWPAASRFRQEGQTGIRHGGAAAEFSDAPGAGDAGGLLQPPEESHAEERSAHGIVKTREDEIAVRRIFVVAENDCRAAALMQIGESTQHAREKHAGNDLRHEVEPELNTAVCMKRPGIVHIELMFKGEIEPVRRIGPQPKKQPGGYEQPKDDVPVSRFACIGQTEVGCGTAAEQVENGRHNDSQTER